MLEVNSRGFNAFVGKTVKSIDTEAINVVKVFFTDGTYCEIWAEERHYDIEVITATFKEINEYTNHAN